MQLRSDLFVALFLALFVGGCCTAGSQEILKIKSHPEKDATIVKTRDRCTDETRFWQCTRKGDELVCNRSCGDNVRYCAEAPGAFRTDRSASAHQGSNEDQPTAVPSGESSKDKPESEGEKKSTDTSGSGAGASSGETSNGESTSSEGDSESKDSDGDSSSDNKTTSSPSGDKS